MQKGENKINAYLVVFFKNSYTSIYSLGMKAKSADGVVYEGEFLTAGIITIGIVGEAHCDVLIWF